MLNRKSACFLILTLAGTCAAASAADTSARTAFDAYLAKMKTPEAATVTLKTWDFPAFMKGTFGDRFTTHTPAEQKQMVDVMQKIVGDAMTSPQVLQLMGKAQVKDVAEFKLADDRSLFCYTMDMGEGKTVANQTEFRRVAGTWKITDSGTNGALLSSQLRGQYATVASQMTLAQFVQAMAGSK